MKVLLIAFQFFPVELPALRWKDDVRLRGKGKGTKMNQFRNLLLCPGRTRTHCGGNIVFPSVAKRGNILARRADTINASEDFMKHFCVADSKFVSSTNVARMAKRVNFCLGKCCRHNVSSFCRPLRQSYRLRRLRPLRKTTKPTTRPSLTIPYS